MPILIKTREGDLVPAPVFEGWTALPHHLLIETGDKWIAPAFGRDTLDRAVDAILREIGTTIADEIKGRPQWACYRRLVNGRFKLSDANSVCAVGDWAIEDGSDYVEPPVKGYRVNEYGRDPAWTLGDVRASRRAPNAVLWRKPNLDEIAAVNPDAPKEVGPQAQWMVITGDDSVLDRGDVVITREGVDPETITKDSSPIAAGGFIVMNGYRGKTMGYLLDRRAGYAGVVAVYRWGAGAVPAAPRWVEITDGETQMRRGDVILKAQGIDPETITSELVGDAVGFVIARDRINSLADYTHYFGAQPIWAYRKAGAAGELPPRRRILPGNRYHAMPLPLP